MPNLDPATPHIQPELTRVKTADPIRRFEVRGRQGTLTFDPAHVALSTDGDLPARLAAYGYATECRDVLAAEGEDALLDYMVAHYRLMVGPQVA